MAIIPYLVSRGSSTIEKLAFSASAGLFSLRVLEHDVFNEFNLKDLLIYEDEYGFQLKFLQSYYLHT